MRPTHVWKGGVTAHFKLTSHSDGPSCGLEGVIEGRDLVVFANESDGEWAANLCGGTAAASAELIAELTDEVGPGEAVDVPPGAAPEADVAGQAGTWILPTVVGAGAVGLVGAALFWRARSHRRA